MPTSECVAAPHPIPLPALMVHAVASAMRGEREECRESEVQTHRGEASTSEMRFNTQPWS